MFAHADEFVRDLPVSQRCGATDLDPEADIDMGASDELLTARVVRELRSCASRGLPSSTIRAPTSPTASIPKDEPFQPATTSKSPDENAAFFNYYRNAVHAQDTTIADLLAALRRADFGFAHRRRLHLGSRRGVSRTRPARAHGHGVRRGDPRPRVDRRPRGRSTRPKRRRSRRPRARPVWHVDLAPTVLDLLGLWSLPELARTASKMIGSSLLRPERTHRIVPLTNCSELWGCAFRNWGPCGIRSSSKRASGTSIGTAGTSPPTPPSSTTWAHRALPRASSGRESALGQFAAPSLGEMVGTEP